MEVPLYTDELLFQLQVEGVVPVLAHPERCRPLQKEPHWLLEAVKRGALVQITGDSLLGRFGKSVQRLTYTLLQAGAVHAVGSDAHSSRDRLPDLQQAARMLEELLGKQRAAAILWAEVLPLGLRPEGERGPETAATAGRVAARARKNSRLWSRFLNCLSRRAGGKVKK